MSAGIIQNIQQYSNFVATVQNYANSMNPTNAKITGYVLDPLWFGPGLLAQLGGYVPPNDVGNPLDPDGSSGFLQDYTALQAWKQNLDPWMVDGNALSWLNAQGRAIVQNRWFEAKDLLAEMKSIAVNHFTTGAPLNVPSDVTTFLNNLNIISLPKLYAMDNFVSGSDRYFIGRVDCGCRDLMIQIPFNNVSELENGTNNGTLATIYYDPVTFENAQLAAYPSGNSTSPHAHLVNLFAGATGDWPCYTNVTENPDLNGYFLVSQPTTGADASANWSLVISGGTDANGNPLVVDQLSLIDTSRGDCPGSCTIAVTNLVSGQ